MTNREQFIKQTEEDVSLCRAIGGDCVCVLVGEPYCETVCEYSSRRNNRVSCISNVIRQNLSHVSVTKLNSEERIDTMNYVIYILELDASTYCDGIDRCLGCAWNKDECIRLRIKLDLNSNKANT